MLESSNPNTWLKIMENQLERRAMQALVDAGEMPTLVDTGLPLPEEALVPVLRGLLREGSQDSLMKLVYSHKLLFNVTRASEPAGMAWYLLSYNGTYKAWLWLIYQPKTHTVKLAAVLPASPELGPDAAAHDALYAHGCLMATGFHNMTCKGVQQRPLFPDRYTLKDNSNAQMAASILFVNAARVRRRLNEALWLTSFLFLPPFPALQQQL